jgi:hypothetical protein
VLKVAKLTLIALQVMKESYAEQAGEGIEPPSSSQLSFPNFLLS